MVRYAKAPNTKFFSPKNVNVVQHNVIHRQNIVSEQKHLDSRRGEDPNAKLASAAKDGQDAALGAMLGLCCGDSIGAVLLQAQFKVDRIAVSVERAKHAMTMPGGGVHRLRPGQVTDAGEMAICLAHALTEHPLNPPIPAGYPQLLDPPGPDVFRYDADSVASWYGEWCRSEPFEDAETCLKAMKAAAGHNKAQAHLVARSAEHNQGSTSNGALMRVVPMAILCHQLTPNELARHVLLDGSMTHPNRMCQDASAVYAAAVAHLVKHPGDRKGALHKAQLWSDMYGCDEVGQWLKDAASGKEVQARSNANHVKIAFCWAFKFLYEERSFPEAMTVLCLQGGDTSSNCAAAGGLLGALYGAEGIPRSVSVAVLNCSLEEERPYWLWPRHVPSLVDKLLERSSRIARMPDADPQMFEAHASNHMQHAQSYVGGSVARRQSVSKIRRSIRKKPAPVSQFSSYPQLEEENITDLHQRPGNLGNIGNNTIAKLREYRAVNSSIKLGNLARTKTRGLLLDPRRESTPARRDRGQYSVNEPSQFAQVGSKASMFDDEAVRPGIRGERTRVKPVEVGGRHQGSRRESSHLNPTVLGGTASPVMISYGPDSLDFESNPAPVTSHQSANFVRNRMSDSSQYRGSGKALGGASSVSNRSNAGPTNTNYMPPGTVADVLGRLTGKNKLNNTAQVARGNQLASRIKKRPMSKAPSRLKLNLQSKRNGPTSHPVRNSSNMQVLKQSSRTPPARNVVMGFGEHVERSDGQDARDRYTMLKSRSSSHLQKPKRLPQRFTFPALKEASSRSRPFR
mmetsp:Transcript_11351/g.21612  ORF Transcript_11351/g.21612 Transcript_11351/m.21612 type:complete len:797 (-) Transcript_11351:200-2590(-)